MSTNALSRPFRFLAATASSVLLAALLGCHSGTPAAPEGTEIDVECEFLTRNVTTGDFEALLHAYVQDEESDVPQVGVGVFFRVSGGPGEMAGTAAIRTDNAGHAQAVLVGTGAVTGNDITVEVSSGPATSEITLDVNGCISVPAVPPVAEASVSPNPTRAGQAVTLDFSDSTDADCAGGKPVSWTIDWGDGNSDDGDFADDDDFQHTYATTPTGNSVEIELEVVDCQGLTDTATVTLNFNP